MKYHTLIFALVILTSCGESIDALNEANEKINQITQTRDKLQAESNALRRQVEDKALELNRVIFENKTKESEINRLLSENKSKEEELNKIKAYLPMDMRERLDKLDKMWNK